MNLHNESDQTEPKGQETHGSSSYPILSPDLVQHYRNHGLDEMEAFLRGKAHHDGPGNTPNHVVTAGSRFIRLNPRYDAMETFNVLKDELPDNTSPTEISWLGSKLGFYSIPASFSLHRSKCFTSGRIYGMDVSSGAAVAALLLDDFDCDKSDVVLDSSFRDDGPFCVIDLCCAPGLKLCTMADLLPSSHPIIKDGSKNVHLIGVDVCPQRMSLCKNIVSKYHIHTETRGDLVESTHTNVNIRLFCADSTTLGDPNLSFNPSSLVFDSHIALDESSHAGKRKRMNKSARRRETKRLHKVILSDISTVNTKDSVSTPFHPHQDDRPMSHHPWLHSFDRVLVDAECSTDGAIYHMAHKIQSMKDKSEYTFTNEKLVNPDQLRHLLQLQQNLIQTGFQLLRPGGKLVYSTCSLSTEQNEGIVSWLISQYPMSAFIIPIAFDQADPNRAKEGDLSGTIRFRPNLKTRDSNNSVERDMYGGGFFIAKIGKKICEDDSSLSHYSK